MSQNLSCLLYAAGDARYADRPIPSLDSRPYDVLVEIAYTGVCGSDVHFWLHGGVNHKIQPNHPLVMGHEASGTISAIGTQVTTLQIGDRVALEPGFPCRRCKSCLGGRYNLCPGIQFAAAPGPNAVCHGTLTKYFALPEDFCHKIPDTVGLDEAVLVEPMAVAVHVVRRAGVKPGQDVVVLGAGTIGLMACAVAREFGAANIIAVDVNRQKLRVAREYAATGTYAVDSDGTSPPEHHAQDLQKRHHLPQGADVIIEATGVESCVQMGIHLVKPGGCFVQVGFGKPMINFPLTIMSEKEIDVKGCFRYGPGNFALATGFLERGRIDVKSLITKVVPFENAVEAWETTRRGEGVKTLIRGQC